MMLTAGLIIFLIAIISAWLKKSWLCQLLASIGSILLGFSALETTLGYVPDLLRLSLPAPWGIVSVSYTPLSGVFGFIFALGSIFAVWYGKEYLRAYKGKNLGSHLFFFMLLLLSLQLTLLIRHCFFFLLVWEIMSFSSFFAIAYERVEKISAAAMFYLVYMQVGAFLLLAGFALAYIQTGSLLFDDWHQIGIAPVLFILLGFACKAGLFPFYSWLPEAHPAAPSHISGLMSGLLLKTGIYGILLVLTIVNPSLNLLYGLLIVSLLTAFLGVIHALLETDMKRILAYSSIENMGIIGTAICLGWIGNMTHHPMMAYCAMAAALYHCLNHSIAKPLLFYAAGNIYQRTHSREIETLGGLQKKMPATGTGFLFGALNLSGLPLTGGFITELLLIIACFEALIQSNLWLTLASLLSIGWLAFVSALALFAFARVYSIAFLGEARSENASEATEVSKKQASPLIILTVITVLLGGVSFFILTQLEFVMYFIGFPAAPNLELSSIFIMLQYCLLILVILFLVLYLARKHKKVPEIAPTWGCGYSKPNTKMQYTGNALVHPLSQFLTPFVRKENRWKRDDAFFPVQLQFSARIKDIIHEKAIKPIVATIQRSLEVFSGLQSGKTQNYIAYGLLFLMLLVIWTILEGK